MPNSSSGSIGSPCATNSAGSAPWLCRAGTFAHAAIQRNLAIALGGRLRGKPRQFLGSDLKIQVGDGHIRYSDGMVVCVPVNRTATVEPVVVFEVLSPSTAAKDRIVKAREYQVTPSIRRYVMLEQDSVGATVYARAGDSWTHEILIADSMLSLPGIGVEIPLAERYEGIVFDEGPDENQPPAEEPAGLILSATRDHAER